jgi:hypothetical protein
VKPTTMEGIHSIFRAAAGDFHGFRGEGLSLMGSSSIHLIVHRLCVLRCALTSKALPLKLLLYIICCSLADCIS